LFISPVSVAIDRKHVDQRSASTRAHHVRLAHLGVLPLAQPLNPLSNFTTSQLLTQHSPLKRTHDCPPRRPHQTHQPTHLLTSTPSPEREQQLRFMSASIENLKSFGMSTEFPHYVRPRPTSLPASTESLECPSLSLTPSVMLLLSSIHRACQT